MDSEIREYEDQLAEVRAALEVESSEELEEVAVELVGLIAELKKKAPSNVIVEEDKPAPEEDPVDGKLPKHSYTVNLKSVDVGGAPKQPSSEAGLALVPASAEALEPEPPVEGEEGLAAEVAEAGAKASSTRLKPETAANQTKAEYSAAASRTVVTKSKAKSDPASDATRRQKSHTDDAVDSAEPADINLEESRSKWQRFAKQKGKKVATGPAAAGGISKKPGATRRPHFAK